MFEFEVKAYWSNGSDGVHSEPMSATLGTFTTRGEAEAKAPELFRAWRKENPESDGWKSSAWYEIG